MVAIKLCVLVQFKSKVLMVKSNLHITNDLPITIKWLKRYRTKIMVKIIIHAVIQETLGLGWKKLVLIEF